jgi:hypothetical protein
VWQDALAGERPDAHRDLTVWLGRLMMEADTVVAPRDRKPREGER